MGEAFRLSREGQVTGMEKTLIGAIVAAVATILAAMINSANVPKLIKWLASLLALVIVVGAVALIGLAFLSPGVLCDLGINVGQDCGPSITGTYLMDGIPARVITVSHIAGQEYQIGEATSPWPWSGRAVLNGGFLSGECHVVPNGDWLRVEGNLRPDGAIEVNYVFLTGPGGAPTGRVDHHVWTRQ